MPIHYRIYPKQLKKLLTLIFEIDMDDIIIQDRVSRKNKKVYEPLPIGTIVFYIVSRGYEFAVTPNGELYKRTKEDREHNKPFRPYPEYISI